MNRSYKYLTVISFSLLVILGLIEKDAFIKRESINWNSKNPVKWTNFRGYPDYLTIYVAGISSNFKYEILNDSIDSIKVETFMYPHHSWVKKSLRDSLYVLRHEQYHFNISEVLSRKFRKSLKELPKESLNKKMIESLYLNHLGELNYMQYRYDEDTEHSIIKERQKDWEYIIDSLLNAYSYYSSSVIYFNNNVKNASNYFRQIEQNAQKQIVGIFPIDSITSRSTQCYKFYYLNSKVSKIEYWNLGKLSIDDNLKVSIIKFQYEKDVEYMKFYDTNGEVIKNVDGIHLLKIDRNKKLIVTTNFDENAELCEDRNGICKIVWSLDYKGRRSIGWIYNKHEQRITDNEGYFVIKYRYDGRDNLIEKANYNSGNKLSNLYNGIAYYRYSYDEMNNMTGISAYNSNNELCPYYSTIAVADYNYDLNGNIIRESFKRADGKYYIDDNRIVFSYFTYDDYSNLIDERHYGLNKNLIIFENGKGRIKRKYDSVGNIIESINYDAYDNLLNDESGKCRVLSTYDSLNLVTQEKQYSLDSLNNISHLKTINYQYDERNNLIYESYLDERNELLSDSNGVCIVRYEYGKKNNLIRIENYNKDNNLQSFQHGVAILKYKYDDKNNKIEAAYFDVNDNLKETVNNIASDRYLYNSSGLLIERRYYNSKNVLTKNSMGVEIVKWEYDDNNNILKEGCYNEKGSLISNNRGIAFYKYTYDDRGNKIMIEFYNNKSKLVENENYGIAIIKYEYSDDNKIIKTSYFNDQEILIDLPEGYAIQKNYYDLYSKLIRTEYYSKFRQLKVTTYGYACVDYQYDKNENLIARIYRDENNELLEDEDGYAIYNWIYNRNGDVVNSYTFKADNLNLTKIDKGAFNTIYSFNFFNESGQSSNIGGTRVQTTFYESGQKKSEVTYIRGKLEGTYMSWYDTGEIESEIEYRNGKRNGIMVEYYKNGQKLRELKYKDNSYVHDSEVTWYKNGKIRSKYKDGKLIKWDKNGNIVKNSI